MNDARVDHIEETLSSLDHKVDGLGVQLRESTDRLHGRIDAVEVRLDGRIDTLAAGMKAGFEQTQAAFEDHRRYDEFLTQSVREDMSVRFNYVERRFDSVDERFDRLERLIKER